MSSRSGSKNRQRQKQVAVRLTDEEHALVIAAAKRQGVSAASVLRYTFLAAYTAGAPLHLLGKRVRVKLDEQVVTEGKLLGFDEGGEIQLLGDDGIVWHGWPALKITEAAESHSAPTTAGSARSVAAPARRGAVQ